MKLLSNPKLVAHTPIISTLLVGVGDISHLHRIWSEGSAAGQSLAAWVCVSVALTVRYNFYRVCAPAYWLARLCLAINFVLTVALVASVVWFR